MWRRGDPSALLIVSQTGSPTEEKSMELPYEIKTGIVFSPCDPTSGGIYLQDPKTPIQKNICTPMFIAVLFTITKI